MLKMRKADTALRSRKKPETSSLDIANSSCKVLLLRAGISIERAEGRYGMGWNEATERLVIPILNDFQPSLAWTARYCGRDKRPKYIASFEKSYWWANVSSCDITVIVEDVFSAIKVYESGYNAIAAMGTAIDQKLLALISTSIVVGWFDADKAGDQAWVKLRKASALHDFTLRRVTSDRDPKLHSRKQIQEKINDRP